MNMRCCKHIYFCHAWNGISLSLSPFPVFLNPTILCLARQPKPPRPHPFSTPLQPCIPHLASTIASLPHSVLPTSPTHSPPQSPPYTLTLPSSAPPLTPAMASLQPPLPPFFSFLLSPLSIVCAFSQDLCCRVSSLCLKIAMHLQTCCFQLLLRPVGS